MIKIKDKETALRLVESFNALSVILPIYDDEARSIFRASFKIDMADLLPEFFRSLALMSIKNKDEFDLYLNYFEELIKYIRKQRDTIPKPEDVNDEYFFSTRKIAEKLLNSWMVRQ